MKIRGAAARMTWAMAAGVVKVSMGRSGHQTPMLGAPMRQGESKKVSNFLEWNLLKIPFVNGSNQPILSLGIF